SRWEGQSITVAPQEYKPTAYGVESDWSGASYWFSLLACADEGEIFLKGLKSESLRSEEHTSELQSRENLVCRLLLEKKNTMYQSHQSAFVGQSDKMFRFCSRP